MSDQASHSLFSTDYFPPFLMALLAFDLFLATQTYGLWHIKKTLQQQEIFMAQKLSTTQSELVPARTMQTMLEGIAGDLLILSNSDPDIRKIVDRFQIRRETPPKR